MTDDSPEAEATAVPEPTPPTTLFTEAEIASALSKGISTQALWLLISFEQYGRAEFDMMSRLLDPSSDQSPRAEAHARLSAFGFLFVSIDKLFRLTAGIRAFRSGREFLNDKDGYLQYGNLAESLDKLADIPEAEWGTILAVPESGRIVDELTRRSASESEVATKLESGADLPRQMAQFAGQMRDETFKKAPTESGARSETFDTREIDNRLRHGGPVIYREFAPTRSSWVPVTADDRDIDGTVGVIMAPPPGVGGPAYIVLFVADEGMGDRLLEAAVKFGEVIRRIAAGFLAELGLGDPLAVLAEFADPRSS